MYVHYRVLKTCSMALCNYSLLAMTAHSKQSAFKYATNSLITQYAYTTVPDERIPKNILHKMYVSILNCHSAVIFSQRNNEK